MLNGKLQIESGGARIGADRIRLLEAIETAGSITAAARSLGLSYRGAWLGVQALNAIFPRRMIEAQVGGADGGAARLTPAGKALLMAFRRIEGELNHVVSQLDEHLADEAEPLDRLAWRLGMKTSARNQFSGVVKTVTPGAVNSEVVIDIGGGAEIVAVVTNESVEELGLVPGRSALALVKASFVILAPGEEPLRTSARNRLPGVVVEHRPGAVNDEVVVEIAGGVRVTASITRESGEELGFRVGETAQALIKASHVLVAVD